jgi:ADP-ribose pyrophosphatase YjhB (NUDIX family)
VFRFVSRVTPLINVDLLIQDDRSRTLLTWRDDEFFGAGWHVPGGIIRYKESAADRIHACAREELSAEVSAEAAPLLVSESIVEQRRGHHISLLFRCRLLSPPDEARRATSIGGRPATGVGTAGVHPICSRHNGPRSVLRIVTEDTPSARWTTQTKVVSFGGAALLAAVLLYYSLRGIEWRQVARIVASASPGRLALAAGLGTTTLFLRACRWRILLNAEGDISVATAFWATAAGYFGNNFLPVRGGELVRTFMISSRSRLENAYVLATALSERVADAIALVVISAAVLLILPAQPGWLSGAARSFAMLGLLGALGIAVLPLLGGRPAPRSNAPPPHALRPRSP